MASNHVPQGLDPTLLSNLTSVPVLAPPPGLASNFNDPGTRAQVLIVTGTVLTLFMSLSVVARICTKLWINKRAGWDDGISNFMYLTPPTRS